MTGDLTVTATEGKGWRRALALLLLALLMSVFPAGVLVSVPVLVLIAFAGVRTSMLFLVTVIAMMLALSGARDPLWYVERGWAILLGGFFAGATLLLPQWRPISRALAAVATALATTGAFLAGRAGAWANVDWSVAERLQGGVATWLDAMALLRDGVAVPPALVSAVYRTVELQTAVFPAMVALESLAALGVAWWLFVRLVHRRDDGLGPVASFRFNDHLVWLMIVGLVLVVAGESVSRFGANIAVFMGALYAVRGTGVVVFVSGGLSLIGYAMFGLGILLAAPVVVGFMVVLGVADTWLDLRARVGSAAT